MIGGEQIRIDHHAARGADARCSRHSRPSSAFERGSFEQWAGGCVTRPCARPVIRWLASLASSARHAAASGRRSRLRATRPAPCCAAGPLRAGPGGMPSASTSRPARAGTPGGGWPAGGRGWPPAGRPAGSGRSGYRAACRRAGGAARRRRPRVAGLASADEPVGFGRRRASGGRRRQAGSPGQQSRQAQQRVRRQPATAVRSGHGAFRDGGGQHAGVRPSAHGRVRVGGLKNAFQLAPHALGRQPGDAAHAGADRGECRPDRASPLP